MAQAPPRRAAVVFIFITVLLDMLALGMIIPVLPGLIEDFQGGDTARAAELVGLFGTTWALMQFVASPVLGALSDRFGRRPVVLLSNFGLGLDYVLMAVAPTLGWLFVGRLISGVTSGSVVAALAYVADVTPADRRAKAFGVMGAAFGTGFVFGPAIGGMLATLGPRAPFWVAAGFSLVNAMYGLLVLPESLPRERRAPFSWRRANPVGSLDLLRSHPQRLGFAGTHFLWYLAHQSLPTVFVLYASFRYGWSTTDIGWSLAAVGAVSAAVQGGLVGLVVARFGERRTLVTGLLFGAAGFAIYGLAPTGLWFAIGIPVMSLWGLYGPAAQGLMTQRVGPSEQGRLQGALSSVVGLTGIVGPGIFSVIFALSIGRFADWRLPGAAFLLASVVLVAAATVGWRAGAPSVRRP
jgi:DHA1 family tetracycline resistance protein-like MFS transporter